MELRDVLRLLRDHWLAIVAAILLGTLLAFGWSLTQKPRYVADSQGIVSVDVGSGDPSQAVYLRQISATVANSSLKTYLPLATSRDTAEIAIENLGLDISPSALISAITVESETDAPVMNITASASTAEGAQKLADAWVAAVATRIQQVNAETGAGDTVSLAVVQAAALPASPAYPNLRLVLAIGALAGLVLGLVYAFVRNTLDRRIRTAEMVERLFDLPVVGTLPVDKRLNETNRIVPEADTTDYVKSDGKHALAEALRELRTNLQFMNVDSPPRIIVVTSPLPSDGKSTVTANLAVTLAASGQRTVVVDGDLRKPTVAKSFGLVPGVGLTDLLIGKAELQDVLQPLGSLGQPLDPRRGVHPAEPERAAGLQRDGHPPPRDRPGGDRDRRCSSAPPRHRRRHPHGPHRRRARRDLGGQDHDRRARQGDPEPRARQRSHAGRHPQPVPSRSGRTRLRLLLHELLRLRALRRPARAGARSEHRLSGGR
ncbi:lipopolysaccharide biosynthesis protein [Rathayibacter oskolensis]|uniref:YveK family protein n=1 Tax=Rathayibacter oskolensis TaxID=1891671 RepID=UPI00265EB32C|nr:lipopolysaccharide biosynthesis protein [Rathayibacter oskolensis]WKK70808.1 lipopolysaccharide biosynthesis protein [Rathayibacter oskolensis]